jgi:hypothetical protein
MAARIQLLLLLSLLAIATAATTTVAAQPVAPNPAPKAGDVCIDRGWTNVPLGPCEQGTTCEWFKRGVHKCTRAPLLPEGSTCFDNAASDEAKARFREFGCERGTACMPAAEARDGQGLYRCGRLPKTGCFVLAGSAYWPPGLPHTYEAATGQVCGMPGTPACVCAP